VRSWKTVSAGCCWPRSLVGAASAVVRGLTQQAVVSVHRGAAARLFRVGGRLLGLRNGRSASRRVSQVSRHAEPVAGLRAGRRHQPWPQLPCRSSYSGSNLVDSLHGRGGRWQLREQLSRLAGLANCRQPGARACRACLAGRSALRNRGRGRCLVFHVAAHWQLVNPCTQRAAVLLRRIQLRLRQDRQHRLRYRGHFHHGGGSRTGRLGHVVCRPGTAGVGTTPARTRRMTR
jgi:hypothetical protein